MKLLKENWHKIALILILALTGFLSFYSIGSEGFANEYYSAAVKSMLSSWHNFFFASFDPGGYVSVDKPALGLWLQALSAYVFGFHGWSLILPEALSAVVSVALIYSLVQRSYGRTAGIVSALVLGLTPILIAVSKTNNLDSSLVMVLLLATLALVKATEKGSFKHLVLAMVLVGLGFNIKMLEAFMVLPAFCLTYFFAAPVKTHKKFLDLSGAVAILIVVSLSWAVIVDMTPAANRPYVGSSQTNSIVELALGYNGIQRITGREAGNSGINHALQQGNRDDKNTGNGDFTPGNRPDRQNGSNSFGMNRGTMGNMGAGGPGGTGENGRQGILRIFNEQLAGQISWLLPMALFGLLILLLNIIKKEDSEKRTHVRSLILWAGWLIPMLIYFSISGFFHRYYLSMLAPAIAALSGIGIVEMWRAYIKRGWKWILLPGSLLITALLQCIILRRYPAWSNLAAAIFIACLLSVAGLVIIRILKKDNLVNTIKSAAAAGFITLLIAPAVWSYTPIMYGSQTTLPIAGPELNNSNGMGQSRMPSPGPGQSSADGTTAKLIKYLMNHKQAEKFLVAVSDANSAAPIILETGKAVMAVGGFSGSDNIMTVQRLEQMVKAGEIRYFYISGRGFGGFGRQSEITDWVTKHGKIVNLDGNDNTADNNTDIQKNGADAGQNSRNILYDLSPEKES